MIFQRIKLQKISTLKTLLLINALLISGCATLPSQEELSQNLPQSFQNATLTPNSTPKESQEITDLFATTTLNPLTQEEQTPPKEQLIALFSDSTLEYLLNLALEKNTDIQIAKTRILQAQSQLKSAWGELFPSVSGNLNLSQNNTRTNTEPMIKTDSHSTLIGANLSWELDLFGRNYAAKNARESLYFQSLENLSNTQIILLSDVATFYFTLRELHLNILLTQENIQLYQTILNLTQNKVQSGLLDSTELFTKQDFLTNEQNTLQALKERQEETKNALLVLLDSYTLPFDLSPSYDFIAPKSYAFNQIPAEVLFSRPDIKAAIFSLHAQIYNKANAKASLFPILSIGASIDEIIQPSSTNAGNLVWQIAASLTAPLLNRTQLTQNYFFQDALLQESYLTLQNTLNTALEEIENALFLTQSTQKRLENFKSQFQNAQEYLDFSSQRRLAGLNDDLEHLSNQASYNNAQKSLNTAYNTQNSSLIVLFKAFGGNLFVKKGQ